MTYTDKPQEALPLGSVQAAQELRRQAEETFQQKGLHLPNSSQPMSAEETSRVLHELQVHQIQLEMQNEELRRAQVELDRTRARYFNLYDQAPVGYCTISENGVFHEANLTAATLLGLARGKLVGQTISFFIYQEDQEIYYRHSRMLFATDAQQVCELRMLRPDGTTFWAHLEITAVRDEDQVLVGRIVLSNVTERKSVEEEKAKLLALNRQMQTAESLGRMAGAIAHHFNNKLHVVKGYLELTIDGLAPGDPAIYNLTAAMQAADKAAEVSKMMLTYLGQVNDQQETLDLSEVCRMSMPVLQAAMPKNVTLETDLQSPGPTIKANANQIHQILSSLATNAWEATGDESGAIGLTVKTVSPEAIDDLPRFPCNWQPEDSSYACLAVRDSGCGIADQDIENLFAPFFSTKFIGRGLGLPMVLGLVQAHRGSVTVESSPGRGSVFRVFLPMSAEKVGRQPDKRIEIAEIAGTGTVLLVDDDLIVMEISRAMLAMLGFTVLIANDGIEAVELFRRHQGEIRFVLSDVSMPRMDGWDTLTALRRIDPGIPIILTSGYSEEQVMEGAHPEKTQAFLGKPYVFAELKDAIRLTLAGNKESGETL